MNKQEELRKKLEEVVEHFRGTSRTLCVAEISTFQDMLDILNEREELSWDGDWIAVKDQKPAQSMPTLICTYNGVICISRYSSETSSWVGNTGRAAKYWMPLPQRPKM